MEDGGQDVEEEGERSAEEEAMVGRQLSIQRGDGLNRKGEEMALMSEEKIKTCPLGHKWLNLQLCSTWGRLGAATGFDMKVSENADNAW